MNDSMLPLPGLSSVSGKSVVVKFDGGLLSSDGGVVALREVEQRLRVADRLAACAVDPRAPEQITHSLADIIRFRLLMIGAGYEDGNDANCLRSDPMFKMALDLSPSDRELCSQSTISRLENLPDVRALLRMGRAMVDLYCASFAKVPKRITLDIDDRFDAVHGGQQLRLFNAHVACPRARPEGRVRFSAHRGVRRRGPLRHRRASSRQTPERQGDQALLAPARARDPRSLAPHRDPVARRQPLLRSRGSRLVSRQRPRYRPRRRADPDVAPPCRRSRSQHEGAVRGRARGRQAPPLQGVLRRRAKLEPRRADHRSRRSRRGRTRHALRRHQLTKAQRPRAVRRPLLPARPRRKSHQILEDASGGGSHVLHEGDRQPVPSLPPRWRLLADVGASRIDAEALDVARRPVRHLAPASHQDRRPRRRNENDDPRALADLVSGAGYPASRFATHTAPRHLSDGARGPRTIHNSSFNPQTRSNQNSGPKPERNRCAQTRPKSPKYPETPARTVSAVHNAGLTGRPGGPDVEPPEISWLRAYSNYLTPRVGVGSADSWSAVAIYAPISS